MMACDEGMLSVQRVIVGQPSRCRVLHVGGVFMLQLRIKVFAETKRAMSRYQHYPY